MNKTINTKKIKKVYKKPELTSEKLNSYGAICNGQRAGGKKMTVLGGAPNGGCNASRLNS